MTPSSRVADERDAIRATIELQRVHPLPGADTGQFDYAAEDAFVAGRS